MLRLITTLTRLGPTNLARVALYRLTLKAGCHPAQRLKARPAIGPFFAAPSPVAGPKLKARESWRNRSLSFGRYETALEEGPPDWLANVLNPGIRIAADQPWWTIPDFDPTVGDIKTVWETSRFDWLIAMAQRAALGDTSELKRLNTWLDDWCQANPPYLGPNWKCGQEASIRVMHLALAALILGDWKGPSPGLVDLVRLHLKRIAPTMAYAIGQQNNHGTSEAAALFVGGSWLEQIGDRGGARHARAGRRWLENRGRVLIEQDGTFSQYSVNYHRMMLDTYALAEAWRHRLELSTFSSPLYARLTAAVRWLYELTDANTGYAPNLGANDGARLIALTDTDYRDFRPSVQLAAGLLANARAFADIGEWDQPLAWLGQTLPDTPLPAPVSRSLDDGGFHILRNKRALALLRYPRFRFRPNQADALHIDLWVDHVNLLRDGGSYSYNVSAADTAYFNGAPAHNVVEVDGRDQMPRIGRFLFGAWLRSRNVHPVHRQKGELIAAAGYRDAWLSEVDREVVLAPNALTCHDSVAGPAKVAVLRWRLAPGDWSLTGATATNGATRIEIDCSVPLTRLNLIEGWESLCYLEKTPLPVLEAEIPIPCDITTRIAF